MAPQGRIPGWLVGCLGTPCPLLIQQLSLALTVPPSRGKARGLVPHPLRPLPWDPNPRGSSPTRGEGGSEEGTRAGDTQQSWETLTQSSTDEFCLPAHGKWDWELSAFIPSSSSSFSALA